MEAWLEWEYVVGVGGYTLLLLPSFPQYRTDQGFQCRPSVRNEETWRKQPLSTGAVPTALHTVEDLLLQFSPLLLLLGQALRRRLQWALGVVQDFAVLGVPQVRIQAARGAEEGVVVAALCHFTLADRKRIKGQKET